MDVREKLVEIVKKAAYSSLPSNTEDFHLNMLVTNLLAHGVTVQEWISVDDRLPEEDRDVLAYSMIGEESRIYPACYSNGVWFDCVFNAPATDTTTHWMPIPQPPKGE